MRKLIRRDPGDKLFLPKEWWLIGDSLEVVIGGNQEISLNIRHLANQNGHAKMTCITLKTAQFLLERGYKIRITPSIDTYNIVIPSDKDTLDSILNTLETTTLESILNTSEIDVKKYISDIGKCVPI